MFDSDPNGTIPTSSPTALRQLGTTGRGITVALTVFIASLLSSGFAAAATFLVNSTSDNTDAIAGNGTCSTGNIIVVSSVPLLFGPECTLRAAIEEANANAGADQITFSGFLPTVAGVVEISPATSLPPIFTEVTIDGYSHPSYDVPNATATPIINILGSSTPAGTDGLVFLPGSDASVVRGIAVTNFPSSGILLSAFFSDGPENITIQGNHIGISRGVFYNGNDSHGIEIQNADNNTIGQTCSPITGCQGKRNIISANDGSGVFINASTGTRVAGNFIGVDRFGNSTFVPFGGATANGEHGVFVSESSTGNFIGNTGATFSGGGFISVASGNVISGNSLSGINIQGPGNFVLANRIGTNALGTSALGNTGSGIFVGGDDTTIGGLGLRGNLISGNGTSGISVDSEFGGDPFRLLILNNRIGVNAAANAPLGNGNHGMLLWGGNHEINDNIVGGNAVHGISDTSNGSLMLRNYIGTNANGDNLGNVGAGLRMSEGNQVIGGAGNGNIIGFNADGIVGNGSSYNNRIVGNYIGTNPNGDDLGNLGEGISNNGAQYSVGEIDGRITGDANTIAFNGGHGIHDTGFNTQIQGNFVGTNSVGADLGNDGAGIIVETIPGPDASVGATLAVLDADVNAAGNVVAYNGQGIVVDNTNELPVRGNLLIANDGPGIDLEGDGSTINDRFDSDTGANELQNSPALDTALTFFNPGTGEIQIRFGVSSTIANSAYPLTVDFYIYDPWLNPGDQARAHLGSVSYGALDAGSFVTASILPTAGSFAPNSFGDLFGGLRATATDANGNTSELTQGNVPVPESSSRSMLAAGLIGVIGFAARKNRAAA